MSGDSNQAFPQTRRPQPWLRLLMVAGVVGACVGVNAWLNLKPPPPPPPPPPPKLPIPAREVQADTWLNTNGKPLRLEALQGKIVVVAFWRSHCPACEESHSRLAELARKYANQGVAVITIHTAASDEERDETALRAYLKRQNITLPVAVDHQQRTIKSYKFAMTTPTFIVINRRGNVIDYQPSKHAIPFLESDLEALLSGKDLESEAAGKNGTEPTVRPPGYNAGVPPSGPPATPH